MAPRRRMHWEGADRELAGELAALAGLPSDALKERWHDLYGKPPPPRLGRAIMVRAIAWHLQARARGGLRPATRRRLARAAEDLAAGRIRVAAPAIKPGTRLLRTWRGVTHEVIIMEEGVRYRGATWPSLSAVAREITGARWSGPRFFGLKEG